MSIMASPTDNSRAKVKLVVVVLDSVHRSLFGVTYNSWLVFLALNLRHNHEINIDRSVVAYMAATSNSIYAPRIYHNFCTIHACSMHNLLFFKKKKKITSYHCHTFVLCSRFISFSCFLLMLCMSVISPIANNSRTKAGNCQ